MEQINNILNEKEIKNSDILPKKFFDFLKQKITNVEQSDLQRYYAVTKKIKEQADLAGQSVLSNRLNKKIQSMESELKLRENVGVDSYILKEDIFNYIENVKSRSVKITELSNYQRSIPGDIIEKVNKCKDYFDEFLVLFTDYTGESAKQMEQFEKDKDPIIFGIYYDDVFEEAYDRFYYIADWEDDYCDLTLDKLIMEFKEISDEEILKFNSTIPEAVDELNKELKTIKD